FESGLNNPLSRGALFAHDLPIGYNFEAMTQRLLSQLPNTTPTSVVGRGQANATANLIAEINTGKYLVNYSGHGATGTWASNDFFNVTMVPQLANTSNPSIFTMLTCLNGFFHSPIFDSFAEVLAKANNGGAVASWASTGETTPDVQEFMAQRFFNRIGSGDITRLGDLIKDAKTQVHGGTDVRLSWVLIGDPMLKVK
ncbi:MAG: C25 family cysteine peptidase, partial [Acidobacteria bacterium]|nr:C25 family cysteine peptidase [Acidobacteriota bacterium]